MSSERKPFHNEVHQDTFMQELQIKETNYKPEQLKDLLSIAPAVLLL